VNPRLELSTEEMRRFGYQVIDAIVEHLSSLPRQPVGSRAATAAVDAPAEPIPETGLDFAAVFDEVRERVLPSTMHVNHPRFFAYVPSPSNFVSAMADAMAAAWNVFAGTWISGSGAAIIERTTIEWLRAECGFPEGASGLFVSGGTVANLTALAVARHVKVGAASARAMVYCSDQTHSSVMKALRVLGFGDEQVRVLGSDSEFRLSLEDVSAAMEADRAAGLRPFCIIANAGTTNTGAVDPLRELAELCHGRGMWLHVDGAYGAAAVMSAGGRASLHGLELADSLTLDPHKWLFQPFETGCVLLRDGGLLRATFEVVPEYLKDTHHVTSELNYMDAGIQLTRSFRALKLWMSLKVFGAASFRAAMDYGFALAESAEGLIRSMADWEIVTEARMAVVCFRYRAGDDAFHMKLVQKIVNDGFALITSTALRGRTVLRMCTINPRTTEDDVRQTLERVDRLAHELEPG